MEKSENPILMVLKGSLIAVLTTLVCILVFAIFVKVFMLDTLVIKGVNQFFKVLSIFLGCMLSIKGKAGYLKGGLIGALFSILAYLTFALIGGEKVFQAGFFIDLVFGIILGSIFGIICVNRKNIE